MRDYINTAMKMGELLNSIGGSKVSDTVYQEKDGTIKMNSIKPELGRGLCNLNDKNRGRNRRAVFYVRKSSKFL